MGFDLQAVPYDDFLHGIDAWLLGALRPIDVLRFWRSAGGVQDGQPWLAVFGIDEARALIVLRRWPAIRSCLWLGGSIKPLMPSSLSTTFSWRLLCNAVEP